jgi:hypothetical protein
MPGLRVGDKLTGAIDYTKIGNEFGRHADKIVRAVKSSRSNVSIHAAPGFKDEVSFKRRKI